MNKWPVGVIYAISGGYDFAYHHRSRFDLILDNPRRNGRLATVPSTIGARSININIQWFQSHTIAGDCIDATFES